MITFLNPSLLRGYAISCSTGKSCQAKTGKQGQGKTCLVKVNKALQLQGLIYDELILIFTNFKAELLNTFVVMMGNVKAQTYDSDFPRSGR